MLKSMFSLVDNSKCPYLCIVIKGHKDNKRTKDALRRASLIGSKR